MKQWPWREGNRVALLENGEEYFPRVIEAIRAAQSEVLLETFILFDDKVGRELQAALIDTARRGVRVEATVDGYGSYELTPAFISEMTQAGVRFQIYDPRPTLFGIRVNVFRRLHRKIIVVDGKLAFIGGINHSADHLRDFGPAGKQDYAVEVEGPVVADLRELVESGLAPVRRRERRRWWRWQPMQMMDLYNAEGGAARAMLVVRDNHNHRTDIERHYRAAVRSAREEVIIANAYFFPGYRLLRELRNAARRGVRVSLVTQGEPDKPIVQWAARQLAGYLVRGGVRMYEYCERPLHGKVALIDRVWSTVGSSNLDPLSLALNLEANLMIRDRAFNAHLRERLDYLIQHHCKRLDPSRIPRRTLWRQLTSLLVFHFLRNFPAYINWLPMRTPGSEVLPPEAPATLSQRDAA